MINHSKLLPTINNPVELSCGCPPFSHCWLHDRRHPQSRQKSGFLGGRFCMICHRYIHFLSWNDLIILDLQTWFNIFRLRPQAHCRIFQSKCPTIQECQTPYLSQKIMKCWSTPRPDLRNFPRTQSQGFIEENILPKIIKRSFHENVASPKSTELTTSHYSHHFCTFFFHIALTLFIEISRLPDFCRRLSHQTYGVSLTTYHRLRLIKVSFISVT